MKIMPSLGALAALCLALCGLRGLCGENLVFNGDFEMASAESPPPGWTMWGASQWKIKANYTRDTTRPHGGQAGFRIHHPANTAGYIVSSPEHAIQPRRGMMYTVTFWARTDRPGSSSFGFDVYESLRPFIDAPSPGFYPIDVGEEWRQFTFVIHEGWDFFADRSRYLLLTFKPTTNEREEKTLWIDDVAVTEQPSTREGRLVDFDHIEHAPLAHRLSPREDLAFTVDPTKRLKRATREAGGVSFHRVAGWTGVPYDKKGDYTLAPQLEQAIREMKLPMTRFYAVGDEPFGLEGAIDRAAEFLTKVGIPQDRTVLEFETQGATAKIAPEVWARGVRHSLDRGYGFRHWEIANEPYLGRSGSAFPTPDSYIEHFKAVSRAIRQVHPAGQIGVAINHNSTAWGSYVLKQTAGSYDFVVGHYYCFVDLAKYRFEDVVLSANYRMLDEVLKVNALIRQYNPGREVYQLDTEWGMHCGGLIREKGERADYVDRNANIYGTLHRAVRLIYYAREDMLRGASSWEMFTRRDAQGFGILSREAPDQRFLLYWLYYLFSRHVGEWVLETDGIARYYRSEQRGLSIDGPLTPVLATLSGDGKTIYLVIVNGSWERIIPARVTFQGFRVARATGVTLSNSDPDGKPLQARKDDAITELRLATSEQGLSFILPSHSANFITVERE